MKTKINFFLIVAFFFSIIFCSCGDLSRSKARKLILQEVSNDKFYKTIAIEFEVNPFNGKIRVGYQNTQIDKYTVEMLVKKGYITLVENDVYLNINPKVRPFTNIENRLTQRVKISVATIKDIKITGITGSDMYRKVEFDIVYTLNDLGKDIFYSGSLFRRNAMDFKKYDDGWRVRN